MKIKKEKNKIEMKMKEFVKIYLQIKRFNNGK